MRRECSTIPYPTSDSKEKRFVIISQYSWKVKVYGLNKVNLHRVGIIKIIRKFCSILICP